MKCFSMFTGIGGFDLALQNLGHEIVGACEIDKYARSVFRKHFKNTPIYNDARYLHEKSLPHFDLLSGGFPCQAFSIAGKRRGFDDTRGSLFFEIARLAKQKRPSYLFLENVKGLLNHDKGQTFRTIISTLDEVGYDVEWQLFNSKYHVPQNRERLFIIGHLRGKRRRQIFPLGDYDQKTDREIKKAGQLTNHNGTSFYDISGISPTLIASEGSGSIVKIKHHVYADSQAHRVYNTDGISPTLGAGNSMSRPKIGVVNDKKGLRQIEKSTCIDANYFKGHDNHGARTMIVSPKKRTTTDNITIRRLTPKECERLQGFPDDWTKYGSDGSIISDTQRYKMCGNAVTVPVVEFIAKHLTDI